MDRKMPTARAGNYSAPVDTTGMDPEMQKTLSIQQQPVSENPIVAGIRRMFGDRRPAKTAAQKSASVKRTSDIPVLNPAAVNMEKQFSAERKSARVSRTSDIPVVKAGQGLQGNRHINATGSAVGGTGSQGHGR